MKALNKIKERAEKATKEPWEITIGSGNCVCTAIFSGNTPICDCLPDWMLDRAEKDHRPNLNFIAAARRDISHLCEALEYLLGFLTINCEARDVVEQILSGTTEKGKDAGKVNDER